MSVIRRGYGHAGDMNKLLGLQMMAVNHGDDSYFFIRSLNHEAHRLPLVITGLLDVVIMNASSNDPPFWFFN